MISDILQNKTGSILLIFKRPVSVQRKGQTHVLHYTCEDLHSLARYLDPNQTAL